MGLPYPRSHFVLKDGLRINSNINKLSMTAEQYIIRWIWPYVSKHIDRDQFGGVSGNSVCHYLIELTNFILYNQDLQTPIATIVTLIDFSKGFNRIDHSKLIVELHRMNVPGWILRIIVSLEVQGAPRPSF